MPEKICAYCGKRFNAYYSYVKYCSAECRRHVLRGDPPPPGVRHCAHCGTPFAARVHHQKYCSKQCASKAWYYRHIEEQRERSRHYHDEHREEIATYYKLYYFKNREKILERMRRYSHERHEEPAAKQRARRAKA